VIGWISLHRKVMDNPIYSNAFMLKLWIHCLMKASHKEHDQLVGNQMVKLEPGQFVTGRNALADEFNKGAKKDEVISAITLWRWLKNFEEWQMLNIKTTTKYSVVTVVKWNEHQQREQQVNNKRTTDEQQVNTNNNVNNINKFNNENNDLQQPRITEEDNKKTSQKMSDVGFKNIVNFVSENIQPVTPFIGESIEYMLKDYHVDLVQEALKVSVDVNARSKFKYAEGVLRNWKSELITNMDQLNAKRTREANSKQLSYASQPTNSLFEPSPETLERERQTMERFKERKERGDFADEKYDFD